MPAIDKLSVINSALVRTGNAPLNVLDNGSDAWIVASQVYEDALPLVMALRDWKFQTALVALQRVGGSATGDPATPPVFPGFTDIFAKPADCLQLQNVWRTDVAGMVLPADTWTRGPDVRAPELEYRIIGDQVHTCAPQGATAKYMLQPTSGLGVYPALFAETLKYFVASGIAAGLNEDASAAEKYMKMGEATMEQASTRDDQQEPRRSLFRSRMLQARRGWRGMF
jgi:hypothetical protein